MNNSFRRGVAVSILLTSIIVITIFYPVIEINFDLQDLCQSFDGGLFYFQYFQEERYGKEIRRARD